MIEKTITYKDYDGNERTETFRFNLNEFEVTQLEMSVRGGLSKAITNFAELKDGPAMFDLFTTLIVKAYGEKDNEGKHFVKSPEISKAFMETPAFVQIFKDITTDEEACKAFILGVFPPEIANKMAK